MAFRRDAVSNKPTQYTVTKGFNDEITIGTIIDNKGHPLKRISVAKVSGSGYDGVRLLIGELIYLVH